MVDRAIIAEVRDFLLSLLTAQLRQLAAANASTAAAAAAAAGGGTFAVPSHDSFVSIAGIPRAVGRGRKRNSSTASSEGAGNRYIQPFCGSGSASGSRSAWIRIILVTCIRIRYGSASASK
jgi:hypothetical protein